MKTIILAGFALVLAAAPALAVNVNGTQYDASMTPAAIAVDQGAKAHQNTRGDRDPDVNVQLRNRTDSVERRGGF